MAILRKKFKSKSNRSQNVELIKELLSKVDLSNIKSDVILTRRTDSEDIFQSFGIFLGDTRKINPSVPYCKPNEIHTSQPITNFGEPGKAPQTNNMKNNVYPTKMSTNSGSQRVPNYYYNQDIRNTNTTQGLVNPGTPNQTQNIPPNRIMHGNPNGMKTGTGHIGINVSHGIYNYPQQNGTKPQRVGIHNPQQPMRYRMPNDGSGRMPTKVGYNQSYPPNMVRRNIPPNSMMMQKPLFTTNPTYHPSQIGRTHTGTMNLGSMNQKGTMTGQRRMNPQTMNVMQTRNNMNYGTMNQEKQ